MSEITEKALRNVALETPDNFQRAGRLMLLLAGNDKSEILGLRLGDLELPNEGSIRFAQWQRSHPETIRRVYDFEDGSYQLNRVSQPTRGLHFGLFRIYLFGNDGHAITGLQCVSNENLPKRQIDNRKPAILQLLLGKIVSKPIKSNVTRGQFRRPLLKTKEDFAEEIRSVIPSLEDLIRSH